MEIQLILSIHEFRRITNTAAGTLGSQGKEGVKAGNKIRNEKERLCRVPKMLSWQTDISQGASGSYLVFWREACAFASYWLHLPLSPAAVGFVSEDEYLEIQGITREQSGEYECSASNDVAAPVVRRVKVTVNCEWPCQTDPTPWVCEGGLLPRLQQRTSPQRNRKDPASLPALCFQELKSPGVQSHLLCCFVSQPWVPPFFLKVVESNFIYYQTFIHD